MPPFRRRRRMGSVSSRLARRMSARKSTRRPRRGSSKKARVVRRPRGKSRKRELFRRRSHWEYTRELPAAAVVPMARRQAPAFRNVPLPRNPTYKPALRGFYNKHLGEGYVNPPEPGWGGALLHGAAALASRFASDPSTLGLVSRGASALLDGVIQHQRVQEFKDRATDAAAEKLVGAASRLTGIPATSNDAASIKGHGDYVLSGNSIGGAGGGAVLAGEVPKFSSTAAGTIRVSHKEYIGEVSTAGTAFANQRVLALNPGISETFPWLSTIAANFEEYEFKGLTFCFVSESADALNSTNTALGSVMMATQYNANLPALQSKEAMLQYEFSNTGRPSASMIHAVECARPRTVLPEMYIRTGVVSQDLTKPQDYRFYDWGTFQIATQGQQAPCVIGELWVTYDVILRKPRLPGAVPGNAFTRMAYYLFSSTTLQSHLLELEATGTSPLFLQVEANYQLEELKVYDNIGVRLYNGGDDEATPPTGHTVVEFTPTATTDFYIVDINWDIDNVGQNIVVNKDAASSNCSVARMWSLVNGSAYPSGMWGPPFTFSPTGLQAFGAPGAIAGQASNRYNVQLLVRVDPSTAAPTCGLHINNGPWSNIAPKTARFELRIMSVPNEFVAVLNATNTLSWL